jgi:hypothetical protein
MQRDNQDGNPPSRLSRYNGKIRHASPGTGGASKRHRKGQFASSRATRAVVSTESARHAPPRVPCAGVDIAGASVGSSRMRRHPHPRQQTEHGMKASRPLRVAYAEHGEPMPSPEWGPASKAECNGIGELRTPHRNCADMRHLPISLGAPIV